MLHFYKKISDTEELCYSLLSDRALTFEERALAEWLFAGTETGGSVSSVSLLNTKQNIAEIGPRLSSATPFSTNVVSVFRSCGVESITRVERSIRTVLVHETPEDFFARVGDRMTHMLYAEPVSSFSVSHKEEAVLDVPLLEAGSLALKQANTRMGLGMDEWDIEYYTRLFTEDIQRNPTLVELFQLSQANSEHSRHWFFRGKHIIDGVPQKKTLIELVQDTLKVHAQNSLIAFADNSSAIQGGVVHTLAPRVPGVSSEFQESVQTLHPLLTAETHNFPTGVAPVPGAETGAGGRMRDVEAIGRGGLVMAGLAGYCVGDLGIEGHRIPGEGVFDAYPKNLASPLSILLGASDGASDYGNKFGEPLLGGFTRSGEHSVDGERRGWLKPVMFSAGIGQLRDEHLVKEKPSKGMSVVMIGGPMYRIGIGGGSASSVGSGDQAEALDFNAVQRGDPEMQQKVNRVIRACVERGLENPILSIHDQGAGGPCNVVTELVDPLGARIDIRALNVGDTTLSVLELWGAEAQERNALLLHESALEDFKSLCARERVPCEVLGTISGSGRIELFDSRTNALPVDLPLEKILGKLPQKTFVSERASRSAPIEQEMRAKVPISVCLEEVWKLPSVGSKSFLVHKVDRSVGGLTVQQQCVGPFHMPIADCAVVAQSHFDTVGIATSIGEQPIKMLINEEAGARLAVAEAITNLAGVHITALSDIKCSLNWMWAAKLPHEGARLYDAALAATDFMKRTGLAVDGGKDSLSMVAKWKDTQGTHVVKAPGEMTVTTYVRVPDIAQIITPDIKRPGESVLLHVRVSTQTPRLGGSAYAQAFSLLGHTVPDVENPEVLAAAFNMLQSCIREKWLLAIHDVSDGGVVTTLGEMLMAGNSGAVITLPHGDSPDRYLFAEEPGWVIECTQTHAQKITELFSNIVGATIVALGDTQKIPNVSIICDGVEIFNEHIPTLVSWWHATSDALELLQRTPQVVAHERANRSQKEIPAILSFVPHASRAYASRPLVAIVREEGSNGDKEMASAFYDAGFLPHDVSMNDLLAGDADVRRFRGAAFVGGFSYGDVLGSAKGWAGVLKFNSLLQAQFREFYEREDTFSLGVCNGCQLMTQLGWVLPELGDEHLVCVHNASGKFESRFPSVRITKSPSIFLRGMEGSVLPVWVAHGEGRMSLSEKARAYITEHALAPLSFVDEAGMPTELYPHNPNGSPQGITALTSKNGRHLALMPHPERLFRLWQWPYIPKAFKDIAASPWLTLFQNAREWVEE